MEYINKYFKELYKYYKRRTDGIVVDYGYFCHGVEHYVPKYIILKKIRKYHIIGELYDINKEDKNGIDNLYLISNINWVLLYKDYIIKKLRIEKIKTLLNGK